MSTPAPTTPIIDLRNVKVHFKSRTGPIFKPNWVKAVDDVTLSLAPGGDDRPGR